MTNWIKKTTKSGCYTFQIYLTSAFLSHAPVAVRVQPARDSCLWDARRFSATQRLEQLVIKDPAAESLNKQANQILW